MASILATGLSSIFAAFAFSGAGVLMHRLDKNGYEAEIKRHNKALEDLAKAKEKFYENEVRQHDRIQQLRQQLADANNDIEGTNKALDTLRKVRSIQYEGQTFDREPQLNDFYEPSSEMKEYQYLVVVGLGIGAGFLTYKYI